MGQVVLDSNNLEAIIKDATGEGLESPELPVDSGEPVETKTEEPKKAETKGTETKKPEEDPDDVEGEDGLTPRQKRDLTQKMQTAIGRKHRALKDAEEFATEQYNERRLAEERAEGFEREIARLKTQLQPITKTVEDTKPKREAFETEEKFRDAMDDWRVDQKFKEREAKAAKEREDARQAEILIQAKTRIAHAIEVVPDFVEVTEAVDWPTPPAIAGYMQESEMFAELGYYLAQHAQERSRLEKLSPARQLVEIGKIESRLSPFAQAKANGGSPPSSDGVSPSTTATEPSKPRAAVITPLSTRSAAQVERSEKDMTAKEALAAFQKRNKINLTKRQRH